MPRKIWVIATSWGSGAGRTKERNLEMALGLLDEAAAVRPDLVCLPEEFPLIGTPRDERPDLLEPIPGPVFDALAERARRYGTCVVAGLGEHRDGRRHNTAVLIDRQGRLAGRYAKVRATDYEIAAGVVPGGEIPVFETDFGRLGIQICYDIGWPANWDHLGAQGAELVAWPSAYDGGFPLQAYAWRNQYYVVSSVWSHFARVIDITGRILARTTRQTRLVAQQIDLEKTLFHTDNNLGKLPAIRRRLGRDVEVVQYSDENYFTLESHRPEWPVARIAREYEMETFRAYHARATRVQDEARGGPIAVAGMDGVEGRHRQPRPGSQQPA
jgi:predicted amidohydrolase